MPAPTVHHAQHIAPAPHHAPPPAPAADNPELFVDLMMGAPLSIYVEKDVPGREEIVRLIEVGRYIIITTITHTCAETRGHRGNGIQHGPVHPRYVRLFVVNNP